MSNINPVTEASVEATPLPPQPAVTNPVGTAAPILPVEDKPLNLGGHEFQSRFILGSGRYDLNLIKATVEHAGTQIVTMALRRAQTTENSVLDYIPEGITLLPNTSGARNAEEAVRIARLAREVCHTDFVKVEIEHETKYLLPDNAETIRATEMLAKEGFVVMPYMFPDPIAARQLEEAGAAAVMPLGSLIGSNMGLRMRDFIEIIIANAHVPVIIDAGIGRPSQACDAMEMGADAVMAYTAVASAGNIPLMAEAFKHAIDAGRAAYLSALTDEQVERYARHLILKGVGVKGQKRLLASSVLIIGAGGLGSPAALYLAAAGVGHIGLVDGDVVDMSNLQRQIIHTTARVGAPKVESAATAIRALNPDVTVDTYYELVDASNIAGLIEPYDLVIDATDNFAAKFLINDACVLAGKPYIHAGVVGFAGQVMTVIPGEGPCYRCIFRDLPAAGEIPTCKEAGVLGAVVGVIGSLEATEAVKLIAGVGEPLVARMLTVDALTMNIRRVPLPKHVPDCPVCGEQPTITAIDPANYIQPACAI